MIKIIRKHLKKLGVFAIIFALIVGTINVTKTSAEDTMATEVVVANVVLESGQYLPNGLKNPTTVKPETGGYVYFENGTLTLNDANIATEEGDLYDIAIYANGNLTIELIGHNQVGACFSEGYYTIEEGIICSIDTTYTEFSDVKLVGDGNLAIYDMNQGICGKNIDIEITGKLTVEEYGEGTNLLPECCIKANGGDITVKSGLILLESKVSYCMYAENINISGGTIKAETNPTYNGYAGLTFNVEPNLADYGYYKISVGNLPEEATLWNMTDSLTTYCYVYIEPSDPPMTSPDTTTPQVTTKNEQMTTPQVTTKNEQMTTPQVTTKNEQMTTPQVTTKNNQIIGTQSTSKEKNVKVGKTKVLKAKAGKKRVSLTLKKVKGATGYIIKYSTSKKLKKAKKYTAKKNKVTIKKLKKGKVYYFKAQAYKRVKGAKIYSKWSAIKASKKIK